MNDATEFAQRKRAIPPALYNARRLKEKPKPLLTPRAAISPLEENALPSTSRAFQPNNSPIQNDSMRTAVLIDQSGESNFVEDDDLNIFQDSAKMNEDVDYEDDIEANLASQTQNDQLVVFNDATNRRLLQTLQSVTTSQTIDNQREAHSSLHNSPVTSAKGNELVVFHDVTNINRPQSSQSDNSRHADAHHHLLSLLPNSILNPAILSSQLGALSDITNVTRLRTTQCVQQSAIVGGITWIQCSAFGNLPTNSMQSTSNASLQAIMHNDSNNLTDVIFILTYQNTFNCFLKHYFIFPGNQNGFK